MLRVSEVWKNKLYSSFTQVSWVLCPRSWVEFEHHESLYSNSTHHKKLLYSTQVLKYSLQSGKVLTDSPRDTELFFMRVTVSRWFFFTFFLEESVEARAREGEGMSKMMTQWFQKAKPGDKGLTRPPASPRISEHKNEVRSIVRGFFQIQFRVSVYKHVGRPRHDSQKREDTVEKVTNVFMEQYTLPTDTNEIPNLPSRDDVKTWWLSNEETMNLRSENDWTIDLQPHTVTTVTHDDDDTDVVVDEETNETHYGLHDPILDVLCRSYLYAWTIKGAHVRFVTYSEHTVKSRLLPL